MKNFLLFAFSGLLFLGMQSCISDDFVEDEVDPVIRISTALDTIELGTTFSLEFAYLNNVGQAQDIEVNWSSSDDAILTVDQDGLITAVAEGSATITVSTLDGTISDDRTIVVGESTVMEELRSTTGVIQTTTFYVLEGDFVYSETPDGVFIDIADNYRASAGLPGLYIYLSNNPNSIAGALEIGEVTTFSGAHDYEVDDVLFDEYRFIVYFCKPFNVKVGDAEIQ
jgi:hypothetical protein